MASFNVIDPFDGVTLPPQLFAERLITRNRTYLDSLVLGDIAITNAETNETVALKRYVELVFQLNDTANVTNGELIPAWSFDESRGVWIEEGLGVVSLSPEGNFLWTFNASQLSWWNCDRPWTDKNCISVNVSHIQNGDVAPSPLSGALVSIEGLSYNYYASVPTSLTGKTCLEAKREELSAIRVIDSLFEYESDQVLVDGSSSSSFCESKSLLWTSNLLGVGGECEEVNILCKNIFKYLLSSDCLCLVADCGSLVAPQNGSVDHPKTVSVYSSMIFVATATFSCQSGFVLSGESELSCLKSGLWSGSSPECRKLTTPGPTTPEATTPPELKISPEPTTPGTSGIFCPELSDPLNGFKSSNDTAEGTVITFGCKPGYFLNGTHNLTCTANGSWSDVEPTCEGTLICSLA